MLIRLTYNVINLFLWLYLATFLYNSVPKKYLMIIQSVAVIEPLLIIFKLVKSSLVTTIIQISSRLLFAWYLLFYPGSYLGYQMFCFAWICTEIIRSCYYLHKNKITTYLRYSAFIILYPLGLMGELLYILKVIEINPSQKYLNKIIFLYILLFPYLYIHMFKQRKKKIN